VCISSMALDQLISAEYLRCRQTRPPVQLIPVVSSNRGKYKHCDCEESRADLRTYALRPAQYDRKSEEIHQRHHQGWTRCEQKASARQWYWKVTTCVQWLDRL